MTEERDLAFTPAYRLRELIAERKLSPVELTDLYLRRVEALNPRLNAFLTVTADEARTAARAAEDAVVRGEDLGPLHGIPTSIKDLVPTKGIRTTRGSLIYKDWVPYQDDLVVERMKGAGAIILGKTNTPEFGQSGTTENRLGDDCRNPWDPERTSGGSSGGAAASVAAGMNPIAQGSDGGGSIRIPSSFCGVYGIKGTQGRVPRRSSGLASWHPVNFSQIGPMSRTVWDAAMLLQVMAGPHPQAEHLTIQETPPDYVTALGQGVKGLRMAWSPDLGSAAVDPVVRQATEKAVEAFEELGATVEQGKFEVDLDEFRTAFRAHQAANYAVAYGNELEKHADLLMPYVRENIERGKALPASDYFLALARIERFRAYVRDFFTRHDVLLTPTLAVPAFPCGYRPTTIDGRPVVPVMGFYPFTWPFNATGNPAASVPCGFSPDGLPIGLHIVGRWGDEVTVLRASAAFEEARPWADRWPPVS